MNGSSIARLTALAVLVFAGVACSPKKEEAPPRPKVLSGPLPKIAAAPAWQLQDLDGKVVSSEQFKGKVVVLDFWATWCGPCKMEIPGYIDLVKRYGKDGFTVIGVSIDQGGPDVVKQFVQQNGINYPMVMADEKIAAAFGGIEVVPTTFLIDRNGQIRDKKEGAEETAAYEKKVVSLLN